jgi:hypothetical protein
VAPNGELRIARAWCHPPPREGLEVSKIRSALTFSVLLVCVPLVSGQTTPPDPLGHRLRLSFFEYSGSTDGGPKVYFSRFKGILRDKLSVLVEELPKTGADFAYLRRLSLEPAGEGGFADRLSSERAVEEYWENSRSLLLFRGVLSSNKDQDFFAQSRIYLGELRGGLASSSVSVRLPIRSDEYPTTSDTHSLIVYYALARDAIRMGDESSHVIELLSRCQDKISDLKRQAKLPQNLVEIEAEIKRALTEARSPKGLKP